MNLPAKFISAAVAASLSSTASAAPAAQTLILNQTAANVDLNKVPYCSKKISTNCKKRDRKGAWYIVGAAGIAALVAVVASDDNDSVSP